MGSVVEEGDPDAAVAGPSAAHRGDEVQNDGECEPEDAPFFQESQRPPGKRRRKTRHVENREKEKQLLQQHSTTALSLSQDKKFLRSLLPLLQKVPPEKKDDVKFQIFKLIWQ
ncbi:uncharacterized protein LOC144017424 [Festucalex cinctus]